MADSPYHYVYSSSNVSLLKATLHRKLTCYKIFYCAPLLKAKQNIMSENAWLHSTSAEVTRNMSKGGSEEENWLEKTVFNPSWPHYPNDPQGLLLFSRRGNFPFGSPNQNLWSGRGSRGLNGSEEPFHPQLSACCGFWQQANGSEPFKPNS